jgi:hypothetical protein
MAPSDVLDVDFERVEDPPSSNKNRDTEETPQEVPSVPGTLFDLSLGSDPDWKDARVPFFDGENYIDVKLAFTAELDGVSYGIGSPCDPVVAVAYEKGDGPAVYLSPDDDENEEMMQLMAAQLQDHVGENLQLKRTPRVLTVSGPLDNYTKNWKDAILPESFDISALLEEDEKDDSVDSFLKFMKDELGEEEFEKTMQEDSDDIDPELRALFDIPGLGTEADDKEGTEELLNTILDDADEQMKSLEEFGSEQDSAALKLVGYILPSGKSYSLVQILQPTIIVGKYVNDPNDNRFELLSRDEAALVEPRLGEVCKEDLEKAGLLSA